jgi:N-acetylglucosamine malate deacetylase 2
VPPDPKGSAPPAGVSSGGESAPRICAPIPLFKRLRSDSRFRVSRKEAEELLESLTAATRADESGDGLRILVVVAHPDDEAIGAGALLRNFPDATVAHITDARRRGFAGRREYAAARRAEVVEALKLVGIPEERILGLGVRDGMAARRLVDVCRSLMELLDDLEPDVVLTHPYEGGHTDHDAAAFSVHLACGILRREGAKAPLVLELASYHFRKGQRVRGDFIPDRRAPVKAVRLSPDGQVLKARMFDRFSSQKDCLREFPVDVERFRLAPRYLFTKPPHSGPLDYERHGVTLSGSEWRAQAERALKELRSTRRSKQAE